MTVRDGTRLLPSDVRLNLLCRQITAGSPLMDGEAGLQVAYVWMNLPRERLRQATVRSIIGVAAIWSTRDNGRRWDKSPDPNEQPGSSPIFGGKLGKLQPWTMSYGKGSNRWPVRGTRSDILCPHKTSTRPDAWRPLFNGKIEREGPPSIR
jgi:hypothetical protein